MRDLIATPVFHYLGCLFIVFIFLTTAPNVNAKIQFQKNLDSETTTQFVDDLREKTGLSSLRVRQEGFLIYDGKSESSDGSKTMRHLISGAIDDQLNTFEIKSESKSTSIHFSQTDQGTVNTETGKTRYLVSFDFEDFDKSRRYSSGEALGAFSYAINLFHEIDHKVSYDPSDPIPPSGVRPDRGSPIHRGVIEQTNLVRKELGLIARDSKTRFGFRYRGLVSLFRNTYQILFRDRKGKKKFLRWKEA